MENHGCMRHSTNCARDEKSVLDCSIDIPFHSMRRRERHRQLPSILRLDPTTARSQVLQKRHKTVGKPSANASGFFLPERARKKCFFHLSPSSSLDSSDCWNSINQKWVMSYWKPDSFPDCWICEFAVSQRWNYVPWWISSRSWKRG